MTFAAASCYARRLVRRLHVDLASATTAACR